MTIEMKLDGFHIHMDLENISDDYRDFLLSRGFYHDPFEINEGDSDSTPEHHYTIKLPCSEASYFRRLRKEITEKGLTDPRVKGYMESEVVNVLHIQDIPYHGSANPPFFINTRPLTIEEGFRKSEFHARMHSEHSNPEVIDSLIERNTGLYTVHRNKADGMHVLFTAQGDTCIVDTLVNHLDEYLRSVGGTYSARIVREQVAGYSFFGDFNHQSLPEVINNVNWIKTK